MSFSILFPTNEYTTSSKSPEQIQKLTHPEFTSIDQQLTHIINKGLPIQLPYLYKSMHRAPKITLEFVCQKAPTESTQNQIIIAQSLQKFLLSRTASPQNIQTIFECCLECLNNLQSPANEELVVVLEAALRSHSDRRKLVSRLQQVSRDLGKLNQPIISKVTSTRLISVLARYTGRVVKGDMIDILKRVLGDNQLQARKVWVSEIFPRLLNNMDLQFIQLHLQEKIYEAVWDDNEDIGFLALQSILRNATKFSLEEQNSRIVNLFIDSLTSKRQKISLLSAELMGQAYQKLLHIILKSQQLCLRFWRSLIELSQSKNEIVLRHLTYNLPGILALSVPLYRVDPMCDVYIQLFYQQLSDKLLLASYFHEIVRLFPNKSQELRDLVYWMLQQLFQDQNPCEQALKIVNRLLQHLPAFHTLFLTDNEPPNYFQNNFSQLFLKYFNILILKQNSSWLIPFHQCMLQSCIYFSPQFLQSSLLPKLYQCLRGKTCALSSVIQTIVLLLSRDCNPTLINSYTSKISVQLSKSSRSYQRQSALLFFYHASQHFSFQLFQQYRLGEKFLYFHNDKNFKVKATFLKHLPKMVYFLTKEEKIQYSLILDRINRDNDPQIKTILKQLILIQNPAQRDMLMQRSRGFREREIQKATLLAARRHLAQNRRSSKQLKKEDILKKRLQTNKSKNKIVIKEIPKKKVAPVLVKTSTNFHYKKHS